MKKIKRNILTIAIIILLTALIIFILASIPNYLRPTEQDDILFTQTTFIIVFVIVDLILIGIPAGIHYLYIKDYSRIKSVWFFALFGGITGAFLGEIIVHRASLLMIVPYTLLMLIYAFFYKRFTWWKVALTTYLGGVLIENAMNRSPIQIPTLLWVAFFTYPYFVIKIWENRERISIIQLMRDFKWAIFFSIILTLLAIYNGSMPLIFLGITFSFVVVILCRIFGKKKKKEVSMISTLKDLKYIILSSIILIVLAIYISKDNISPPLIVFGAVLPFLFRIIKKVIKRIKD